MNQIAGSWIRVVSIVLMSALVVSSGSVVAQSSQPAWAGPVFEEMSPMVDRYNQHVDASSLGIAGDQLKNQRVNLVVTAGDGSTATASFRMDGELRISELREGERDDATLRMTADRATMERIIDAQNPAVAFQTAVKTGAIKMHGIGAVNAVKWAAIDAGLQLARLFGFF